MDKLTIIIISKEDSDVILDCIESSKTLTKNILVIDANLDDKTQKICQKAGVRVIKHPFKNFSDQRNFGLSHAVTPFVLYIDSDERITQEFGKEVVELINNTNVDGSVGGFRIRRKTFFYGQDWGFIDTVERLFIRKKILNWYGVVHESPKVDGEIKDINSPIIHLTHRNLSQMVRKTNEWSEYEAKLRLDNSHPPLAPWRFLRVMATEFYRSYVSQKGYKNKTYGLIEAIYQSFSIFITYSKLWEMQQEKR